MSKPLTRLLPGLALACTLALPLAAQVDPGLDFEAFTLENGLKVILVEDHSAPVVAVDVWYRVGGANDPVGRSGFAHLFEHMMFQGTANLTKDELLRLVRDAGGRYNANTGRDHTVFYEYLPSHQVPLALWLEADRMASLLVTQTNLDNQRAVVIQEYQQNYGGTPYGLAYLNLITRPFSYEPYRRAPIGAIEDVNRATVDELVAFHATYYIPNNATLVVAGDFDTATVRDLVERYFGPIPRGAEPPALPAWHPVQQAAADIITIEDDLIRIPAVLIGYEVPPRQDPDFAALSVLQTILGVGDSSRIQEALVATGAALVADTLINPNLGPSLFGAFLIPNPRSTSVEEIELRYYAELDRIAAEGVPQAELDRAIAIARASQISGLETAFALAQQVQTANAYYGDPGAVFGEIDRYRSVTSADIQRVIAEYLAPADRHVIYVNPGPPQPGAPPVPFVGATANGAGDAVAVGFPLPITEPPAPLELRQFNLPRITENVLANGLEVVVVEAPELPVFSIDLVFRGGGSLVPRGQFGLAGITAALLTRGTESRSAAEIAGAIEARGGITGAVATGDLLSVGVFSLVEDRLLATELLADMALHPAFPQQELDVQLGRLVNGLDAALGDPAAQVGRAFGPAVYGDHPYGVIITAETAAAIDRDAVVAYYDAIRHPRNGILIIAGRITTEEALELANAHFGGWRGEGEPPAIAFPIVETGVTGNRIVLVDVPGANQAEIIVGNLAIRGDDPARYPLSVLNNVLGEGLSSRLVRSIREERGYAYSIGSSLFLPVDVGTFQVGALVQTSAAADTIREIIREIDRIVTEPIGDAELAAVRGGMIGRFALNLETQQSFVNLVASFKIRGVPLAEIAMYPARIAEADPRSILEAAGAHMPRDYVVVVAGDRGQLLEQLEGIGPVTVVAPR